MPDPNKKRDMNEDGVYDIGDEPQGGNVEEYYDDPDEDIVDDVEEPIVEEPEFDDDAGPEPTWTQEDFDAAIKRRLKRQERSIARELGVELHEAREWISAGKTISEASGLTPAQIKQKMEETRMQQAQATGQQYVAPVDSDLKTEVRELKEMITSEHEDKIRRTQESEAQKEFGDLYKKHRDAIEDKAGETGLSLVDAAAIVLRPKLKDFAEERARNKRQVKQTRKIEGSDDGPSVGATDYNAALSNRQKTTARKMGVSLEKYYKSLKELGEIE